MIKLRENRLLLTLALLPLTLPAQTPQPWPILRPYSVTHWNHQRGLPSSTIYAITQTGDGYLWLGTADGLIQFDGIRFIQIPLSTRTNAVFGSIRALLTDHAGSLWIGTENGKVVGKQGNIMRVLQLHEPVARLRENNDGSIDAQTTHAVYRFAPATLQILGTCALTGKPGDLCARDFAPAPPPGALAAAHLTPAQITLALTDLHGNTWLATRERGLFRVTQTRTQPTQTRTQTIRNVEQTAIPNGLSNDAVWALFEDREGNLWAGTQNGLNRLRPDHFSTITRDSGLLSSTLTCVATTPTAAYAGSPLGLNRLSADGISTLLRGRVLALAAGDGDSLFAATSQGILHIGSNGKPTLLPLGLPARNVNALTQDGHGTLFFSNTNSGLHRWTPGQPAQTIPLPSAAGEIIALLRADNRGGLWIGFLSGHLAHWNGQTLRLFTEADGLPPEIPHFLAPAPDGTLWIASEAGLSLLQPRTNTITTWSKSDGLPANRVLWALPAVDGQLWLGFNIGIASVPLDALLRSRQPGAPTLPVHLYDDADGLRGSPELNGNDPVAAMPDGRLWLMTADGLATIDPMHLQKNNTAPLARIVDLTADDHTLPLADTLTLPQRTRRIEIGYTGLSLAEPRKVAFRYKLENFDADWHSAGNRRIATYTNLPPNRYRFAVMAVNTDGVWSLQPDTLAFTIPAAFYQTRWFAALCFLAILLALALLMRLRVGIATNRVHLLAEERLKERTRLAQNLHDNLLQDVMGISLQLEIADELTPAASPGKPILHHALALSASALAQGRSALTTLRTSEIDPHQLLEAIAQVAQRYSQPERLNTTLAFTGRALHLRPPIAEELIRIGREATANALQHTSGPVTLHIQQSPPSLILRIQDHGSGFSTDLLQNGTPGHFGLLGMRERATRIAAVLTIHPNPTGTTVQLTLPAHLAYARPATLPQRLRAFARRLLPSPASKQPISHD